MTAILYVLSLLGLILWAIIGPFAAYERGKEYGEGKSKDLQRLSPGRQYRILCLLNGKALLKPFESDVDPSVIFVKLTGVYASDFEAEMIVEVFQGSMTIGLKEISQIPEVLS